MYFAVGRERWLWLDYEHDAAVLHFSAPFRKRAKRLLRGSGAAAGGEAGDEDPRVAWAHRIWDVEVECLRDEAASRGFDLRAWLGEGCQAHAVVFGVVDRGEERGMEIVQVASLPKACGENGGGQAPLIVFEAFASNCAEGLEFFPPSFSPGPPWGTSFWAFAAPSPQWADSDDQPEGLVLDADSSTCCNSDMGSTGRSVENGSDEASPERRVHPDDPDGEAYTFRDFLAFAADAGMPRWYGEAMWRQADPKHADGEESGEEGRAQDSEVEEELLACDCHAKERSAMSTGDDGGLAEAVLGAWLRRPGCRHWGRRGGRGGERWAFGTLEKPPHLPGCPLWQLVSTFSAKVMPPAGSSDACSDASSDRRLCP